VVIPPLQNVEERAAAEVALLGATAEEIERLRPLAREGAGILGDVLGSIERTCLFLGHPRSGHSIVGALLDAHPSMVIAHELDFLRFVDAGWTAPELYWACLENSRRSASTGRKWGPYEYSVPGQWQGRWQDLRVIGDKKGGITSLALRRDPSALDRLISRIPVPICWVHVVRNPWDNIATLRRKQFPDLRMAIRMFFRIAETIDQTIARLPADSVLTVHFEDLPRDPRACLSSLAEFLGVSADASWLDACAELVWASPSRARDRIQWPDWAHASLAKLSQRHAWLAHYGFAD